MQRLRAGLLTAVVVVAVGAPCAVVPARAQDCPGNPNAIGTSRVLTIDPGAYSRLGRMQYPESLPLADKEVVLTFDDGPLPPYSNQVLDILASQCVKVTYFLVGSMARAYPATVRRIFDEGHTIGTHSENHPSRISRLPIERVRQEIDQGIADVGTALGDPRGLAPFFRIPGLDRSDAIESELAARSLIVFSSDTVADDWHHRIKPNQIVSLALSRLEARGKGILLLHDIHPTTVAALPDLLKELKDKGFHIVQVVSAPSDQIEVAGDARTRMLASAMPDQLMIGDGPAQPMWPQSSDNLTQDDVVLPAPDASAFAPDTGLAADAGEVQWPEQPEAKTISSKPQQTAARAKQIAIPSGRQRLAVAAPINRERVRPDRFHAQQNARARAGAGGPRADAIPGLKAFAALWTPAH
jgi:peptidoglycan/xylan/chitin deacetylase (PgdA/CDA1 family)